MSRCKACGAAIIWTPLPSGKKMPCDSEAKTYWKNPQGKSRIVTRNGEVIRCDLEGDIQNATGIGWTPHWATCPNAKDFKKRL